VALADDFDGFLIDLDGVVWIGREPVPGSPQTLADLLAAGKRIAFVTNNPAKFPAEYAERLRGFGVEVGESQIVTAGMVAARLAH
jgi:glycerol 3-phosphatase-2